MVMTKLMIIMMKMSMVRILADDINGGDEADDEDDEDVNG
jgi:hypothetical protein